MELVNKYKDHIVSKLYKSYGNYSLMRSIISYDGLLLVERRILLTANKVARKFTKSSSVVGQTMASLHPHGDQSIYGTLVKLVKSGFFIGQGNFGAPGLNPIPHAAMRYTEVKLNEDFNFLFDYIDLTNTIEIEADKEPIQLSTPFPLLLGPGPKIGLSFYRMSFPTYKNINELKKILKIILGLSEKEKIYPYIEFHSLKTIEPKYASKQKFKSSYIVDHIYDDKKNEVILKGIPNRKNKLLNLADEDKIYIEDNSSKEINIKIKLKNYSYESLKNNVLESSFDFELYVYDLEEKTIKETNIHDLFLETWNKYVSLSSLYIKAKIEEIKNKINELIILKVAKEIIKTNKEAINDSKTLINLIENKVDQNLRPLVKNVIANKTIKQLVDVHIDIEEKEKELKEWENYSAENFSIKKLESIGG